MFDRQSDGEDRSVEGAGAHAAERADVVAAVAELVEGRPDAVAVLADALAAECSRTVTATDEHVYDAADVLLDAALDVDRHITRAQSARAALLSAIADTDAHTARGCVTTASWWRHATHRDHASASRQVTTARRLSRLPHLRAAFADGTVTTEHVDAVTAAMVPGRADAVAAADATLTRLATDAPPRDVRVACRRIADLVDRDGTTPAGPPDGGADDPDPTGEQPGAAADTDRGLWLRAGYQGRWRLEADLDPVTGERLAGLLDAYDVRDAPDTAPDDRRSHPQRRHDAFARLLAAAETIDDLPTRHGARPHVLFTIDLLTLLGHDACATHRPRLASGTPLAVETALDLLRRASLTPIIQLGPWRTVAVGRRHRTLPPWLRTVLATTHRTCRGPGCDRPLAWSQAAHLDAWFTGGQTDLDRSIPACTAHHHLIDHTGWGVALDPDTNEVTWTRPDGAYRVTTHPGDP